MKTSPAMLGTGKLFSVLFLIPHLGIWNIDGEKSCDAQLYVRRHSVNISAGTSYQLECPTVYCANRPNVTWCKLEGKSCSDLENGQWKHMNWENRKNMSVFILYFDRVLASDNGSYRCSAIVPSGLIESHSITIYVTEHTQNDSKLLINTTSALEPPSKEQMEDRRWILYSLLPLGGLPLLITCFCLFYCLRKHQGKQKEPSDTEEREINLIDVPQPFRSEQTELSTRQNSQTLPSDTRIYDNDPCFKVQEEPEVHSKPCLEENKQGIVYASLNHSVIGMNPRQARNMKEAPTEYAAICVRS
ncbi:B- and T-lymphocyte attenuator isoform X1 [Pteropus medius]|uniref:B- and T-lymphocyte attenuator isoform X1 n=1 Tax=Pteropus vampyrus TaxID=132908 RepID=UPI00196A4C1F|nr:B- and T-lymphocyte attenuator isoform X1 [Pteropus giganteus]XP_039734911.1 B- and T-lymphocyte attenuator isoform X1 [Pteropus giganteus]XP_039734912.1 B- and T-lymphocyte attenuator isoform X1 [Pteropus giganteus]